MLQNTYRRSTPTVEEPKRSFFSLPYFLKDRRLHIGLGLLFLGTAVFLLIAFISHFYHGRADQAFIEIMHETSLSETGASIKNWLGILGALSSYYFIFRWFGIAAFSIPFLLFAMGFPMVFKRKWIGLWKAFIFSIFNILWFNIAFGYADRVIPQEVVVLDYLVGGVGFELAPVIHHLLGWGTVIFLFTTLIIFLVYFFHITSLSWELPFSGFFEKLKQFFKLPSLPKKNNSSPTSSHYQEDADEEEEEDEDESYESPTKLSIQSIREPLNRVRKSVKRISTQPSEEKEEPTLDLDVIAEAPSQEEYQDKTENYDPTLDLSTYQYPAVDLLQHRDTGKAQVTPEELEQNKDKIIETLVNFKIGISSIKATIGPTVTLYEIVPEAGVKISKIKNLEDDIALSLAALGIRIIAPIPGKGTIGIEVPNKHREMVPFRGVAATNKFMKSEMELPIIMGKTIDNKLFIADLAKMPHLLIAGATGQGKSVGLNVLLASLIFKKHPSQLKFVLVDPKKVELSLYNKLEKHFLAKLPDNEEAIITETKKVVHTLNSLCTEMDVRYELLKEAGTRNIKEYNEKFVKRRLNPEKGHRFLPYIVLVIDEFADMMMTAGKEVEAPIARLAQLARAIGIHLVLATQRPSVNVITGIIKANFPVRLSFRVTSKIDSRTILDTGGAEQLVGQGDMLLSMNSEITRLQCPFLDTDEIENICEFVSKQQGYTSAYFLPTYEEENTSSKKAFDKSERDDLFEEAARLVVAHQQGSTSLVQRKLKLGYNRAGRLIDQLEDAGIVGSFEGSKAREVLIPDEHSLEMLLNYEQEDK